MPTPYTPFPDDWSRALAVVAHPDDLEYGAAGAVARWTAEGRTVTYLLVTRGEAGIDTIPPAECGPLREAEQRAAARVVGVDVVEFLEPRRRHDRVRPCAASRHRPGDPPPPPRTADHRRTTTRPGRAATSTHADHRAVGQAAIDAVADAGNRWLFPEPGLDPWPGVRWVAVFASPRSGARRRHRRYLRPRRRLPAGSRGLPGRARRTLGRHFPPQNGGGGGEHLPGATLAAAFELIRT